MTMIIDNLTNNSKDFGNQDGNEHNRNAIIIKSLK